MKKEITVGQFVSGCITILIAVLTGWITMSNKVSSQDTRIEHIENRQEKTERILERIELTVIDIRLLLQNKKDR